MARVALASQRFVQLELHQGSSGEVKVQRWREVVYRPGGRPYHRRRLVSLAAGAVGSRQAHADTEAVALFRHEGVMDGVWMEGVCSRAVEQ